MPKEGKAGMVSSWLWDHDIFNCTEVLKMEREKNVLNPLSWQGYVFHKILEIITDINYMD